MRAVDLINQAVAKVGLAEIDSVPNNLYTLAEGFLNRVYESVWISYPFRDEKLVSVSANITAGAETLIFPCEIDAVRAIHTSDLSIWPFSEITLGRFAPSAFTDQSNQVYNFFNLPDSPVLVQPTSASTVTFVSGSTADTTQKVRIFGVVSGNDTFEDVTLNGTTPVSSSNSYTELKMISKDLTTGRITISGGATGSIAPWDYQSRYRRIRLYPIPTASQAILVEATRRFPRITSDEDTILLGKCEPAIFLLLMAELYEYNGDADKSDKERKKAGEMLQVALTSEENKDGEDSRSFPDYGMFGANTFVGQTDAIHKTF